MFISGIKSTGNWVYFQHSNMNLKKLLKGQPRWLSGLAPPSAQGVILETQIKSHVGLPAWHLLLPLPVSLPLPLF